MFSEEWYSETANTLELSINNLGWSGFVYIVKSKSTGLIKIGRTKTPQKRLKEISAYVGDLIVISIIPTDDCIKLEKWFHAEFSSFRERNEWFNIEDVKKLNKSIYDNNGNICNKDFDNSLNVSGDDFLKPVQYSKYMDIPENIYEYFLSIELHNEGEYVKSLIFKGIPFEHNYSAKKVNSFIKSYIKHKGMRFREIRKSNSRNIMVFF